VVVAGVVHHRLRRLRATAPLPVIELVDSLAVRARFALQDYATSFAAFDVVHDSSIATNLPGYVIGVTVRLPTSNSIRSAE